MSFSFEETYDSVQRIGCCVHGFIRVTKRAGDSRSETTEIDLIDTVWLQRLRRIHQLETAWWVFPSGEHTRLQHAFGTMHLADMFGRQVYPSLKAMLEGQREEVPSEPLVVETLRLAGLLHDVGHGPFGHAFDDLYLARYGYSHEAISASIIEGPLAELIRGIRRSPHGRFEDGERVEPANLVHLIRRDIDASRAPRWIRLLRPLFQGPFTCDNIDFVLRDAYMCGFSLPKGDVQRMIDYTFFPEMADRLCIHLHGLSSLRSFLESRLELYLGVYYHRTVRGIRIHLEDVFPQTIERIWRPLDPASDLQTYQDMDEWALITRVQEWLRDGSAKDLEEDWRAIILRTPAWKRVYELVDSVEGRTVGSVADLKSRVQSAVDDTVKGCRVDVVESKPLQSLETVGVYNPMLRRPDPEAWDRLGPSLTQRLRVLRVFSKDRSVAEQVDAAVANSLDGASSRVETAQ